MTRIDRSKDIIEIHVQSGKIKCKYKSDGSSADTHEASRGEYVRWSCADGNYTIVFGMHTPFANPTYSKKKNELLSIPVDVRAKRRETFKYSVVVERGVNDHVVRDPEIVID